MKALCQHLLIQYNRCVTSNTMRLHHCFVRMGCRFLPLKQCQAHAVKKLSANIGSLIVLMALCLFVLSPAFPQPFSNVYRCLLDRRRIHFGFEHAGKESYLDKLHREGGGRRRRRRRRRKGQALNKKQQTPSLDLNIVIAEISAL